MNTTMLDGHTTPSVETMLAIIDEDFVSRTVAEADDATVMLGPSAYDWDQLIPGETRGTQIVTATLTWAWHSMTYGAAQRERTVIQVVSGGLVGGEGSVRYDHYVLDRAVTEAELGEVVRVIVAGLLPRRAGGGEL